MRYLIEQTETFAKWHDAMRDLRAKIAIARRIDRMESGNFGDVKSVGDGISELRVDVGVGYRVYFTTRKATIIFLLHGGNKSTQQNDIKRAVQMAKEI